MTRCGLVGAAVILASARQAACFTVLAAPKQYHRTAGPALSGRRQGPRTAPLVALEGQAGDISKCPFTSLFGSGQVLHGPVVSLCCKVPGVLSLGDVDTTCAGFAVRPLWSPQPVDRRRWSCCVYVIPQ
jgi:hypothetical protein